MSYILNEIKGIISYPTLHIHVINCLCQHGLICNKLELADARIAEPQGTYPETNYNSHLLKYFECQLFL